MPDDVRSIAKIPDSDLFEADEHAWIAEQTAAIAVGDWDRLDRPNLIEFLNDMAKRDRRELQSRLTVLLQHLLKVRFQPEKLTLSWVRTILTQQQTIRAIVEDIPSLGQQAQAFADRAYPDAVRRAARETRLPAGTFPATCPWTVAEALAFDTPEPAKRPGR
jgi:hypothetical protein